ncbi:hypothetical protein [Halomarina rubra]|uniref:Small CPxCG-related zinc finger protein n=1 Tax=Halomarina rubra TaxID=2071873 RepID=A0ABD6ATM8_9EURY|nr:hypothetical protein [Halomarina rubra]
MSAMSQPRVRTADPEPLARRATACPECEEALVEGQGLVACVGCAWTGRYE